MQFRQTGSKVTKARLLGYITLVISFSCVVLYLIGFLSSVGEKDALDTILIATFFYIVTIGGILVIGMFNFWKYPDIMLIEGGITLTTFFSTKYIEWENIKGVQKRGNKLFITLKSGGYFLNRFYGVFAVKVWDQPTVIFISDKDIVHTLEKEITNHLPKG